MSSTSASKANLVLKLVDLPFDECDWNMSSHPRTILELHAALCRQMKNLSTFRYDHFSDDLQNFRQALSDYMGEGMEKCKTGKLDGLPRWPLENIRILDQIHLNIKNKGGPSNLKLRDWIEMHVSISIDFDPICYLSFRCQSSPKNQSS